MWIIRTLGGCGYDFFWENVHMVWFVCNERFGVCLEAVWDLFLLYGEQFSWDPANRDVENNGLL